ncbi:hypothetical protein A3D03_03675 [Candidatus Gottesmanbacteria bacterium RIFCSPHIGHO2_02_FULL_40_13]|uniref:ATP-grasp domain-containing protein n=1 Tax=Candidatus Gottesmanbacteria bacterium RIFCSPHIGHO2_02_FULL_40_13 TaxID=1798384 RepID=A0A1F6AA68_9BACT|nr:MAG: hypothetical protein A3D03_03675 [Candidatus Gottesmanbacteria bacterium RIFCSPHIGHO2_02_FULL_40_13]
MIISYYSEIVYLIKLAFYPFFFFPEKLTNFLSYNIIHHLLITMINRLPEAQITTTARMFGLPGESRVIESRMPVTLDDSLGVESIVRKYKYLIGRGSHEATGTPSTEMAIVANPVDKGFVSYTEDFWGRPIYLEPVDLLTFDPAQMTEIMNRLNTQSPVLHYGIYRIPYLPSKQQVIQNDDYRQFNAKGRLSSIVPGAYLPEHLLLFDPLFSDRYQNFPTARPFSKLTERDLTLLMQEDDFAVAKEASGDLMGGDGVARVSSLAEIKAFREKLMGMGVKDTTLVIEKKLDLETGGSFSLVKSRSGEISLLGVTRQLSDQKTGLRVGNVIYDQSSASEDYMTMIAEVLEGLTTNPESEGIAGFFVFDTMRDQAGNLVINDPANRQTGTTSSAQMRLKLIREHGLNAPDVVVGMAQPLLVPGTDFSKMFQALHRAKLTTWCGDRQVVVRSFYNDNGERPVAQFALVTSDEGKLSSITTEIADVLTKADIFVEWHLK